MLSDFKSLAVADASGERVKMALLSSGAVVAEISRDKMAMEIFAESLSELCGGAWASGGVCALHRPRFDAFYARGQLYFIDYISPYKCGTLFVGLHADCRFRAIQGFCGVS